MRVDPRMTLGSAALGPGTSQWVSGIGSRRRAPTDSRFSWILIPEERNAFNLTHPWFKRMSVWFDGTVLYFLGKHSQTLTNTDALNTSVKRLYFYQTFCASETPENKLSIWIGLFWHVSMICSELVQSWRLLKCWTCQFMPFLLWHLKFAVLPE